jgi:1,4-alpha-glucan branching enzyme
MTTTRKSPRVAAPAPAPRPRIGDVDLHLFGEGRHERLWDVLGAHPDGTGTDFAVWAPNATRVTVMGDFDDWDRDAHPLAPVGVSGIWSGRVDGATAGQRYRFVVHGRDGVVRDKADPMALFAERPPANASVIWRSAHEWADAEWLTARRERDPINDRLSVYEVHAGSWRRDPDDPERLLSWREIAEPLADHVAGLGFTHVELLPIAEHPYTPSWGYQVTGFYAPTSRYGTPDDLKAFVDHLHRRGIGVIVDWVPAHFPRDDWALARFDGTALYEHLDPRKGDHPDWGTHIFDYSRHEVRNFLVANALYWLEEFHVDGLRVDAVASMLYLDYSRKAGEWVPNVHGGRENLEAIAMLQEMNTVVHREFPGVLTVAEESTAWGGVSRPVYLGGLGFGHKWNMGWMHDTLDYFERESVHRRFHQGQLTFGLIYAWSENFVLPLSHDEVVHGKGSLLAKMPGDRWQQLANLRALYAWMWAHPGKQLLFMGSEFGQEREWSEATSLDWHLVEDPGHAGVQSLIAALNAVQAREPALYARDNVPEGFGWIDASDEASSVLSFARFGPPDARPVVCVANFTPVPRHGYRVGLPDGGMWEVLLNTDDALFGGSGVGPALVDTEAVDWHGRPWSGVLTLPPLGVLLLAPVKS